jgi:putative flavoprotein involved in K+ transport
MPLDAVVVGAGHAGLAVSRRLADAGVEHVVLERGEVAQTWREQRWDSFRLNTPNALNRLPGAPASADPDAFLGRDAWIAELESYARAASLPVRTHANVTAVERDGDAFVVTVEGQERLQTRSVVVAAGVANIERRPAAAAGVDRRVGIFTTATYRRPAQLPPGAVLVVGSAQSGCQIAEDLLDAGREVYLATGRVGRSPRRLRGRDTLAWLAESGWLTQRPEELTDRAVMRAAQPLISGVGPRGHSVSLQWLAARGVTLLGHLEAAEGDRLRFADDLTEHVRIGDEGSAQIHRHVDEYIARSGIDAPANEDDAGDARANGASFDAPSELSLTDRGIRSIIFSTGFRPDHTWLRLPIFGSDGAPMHEHGRAPIDGLWFVGLLWMRMRRSGIILGAMDDSAYIASQVAQRLRS